MKKLSILFTIFFGLSIVGEDSWSIVQNDHRFGLVVGNVAAQGSMSKMGNGLGTGVTYGYKFLDDMTFYIDYLSSKNKKLSIANTTIGIEYFYADSGSTFFNITGGLAVLNNSVDLTTEVLNGKGSALMYGAGVNFDVSSMFVAGFQLRQYQALSVKADALDGSEITVIDSHLALLALLSIVF
jgi:hypothetical protein